MALVGHGSGAPVVITNHRIITNIFITIHPWRGSVALVIVTIINLINNNRRIEIAVITLSRVVSLGGRLVKSYFEKTFGHVEFTFETFARKIKQVDHGVSSLRAHRRHRRVKFTHMYGLTSRMIGKVQQHHYFVAQQQRNVTGYNTDPQDHRFSPDSQRHQGRTHPPA